MLCIWITLLCCSLACGGEAFDWLNATTEIAAEWDAAERRQNISGIMDIFGANATLYLPGIPPIYGKQAINDWLEQKLESEVWPDKENTTIVKVIAECDTVAAVETSGEIEMSNGEIHEASGVWVFTRKDDVVELVAAAMSSNGQANNTNAS